MRESLLLFAVGSYASLLGPAAWWVLQTKGNLPGIPARVAISIPSALLIGASIYFFRQGWILYHSD